MSFILDALRKSELERQRQSGPFIAELPVAREDRRMPWALSAIGLLLALNVGVLLFFLLRDSAAPAAPAAATAAGTSAAAAPIVTTPSVAAPVSSAPMPASANEMPPAGTSPAEATAPIARPMPEPASLPPPAPDPTLVPMTPARILQTPAEEFPPSIDELPPQATAGLPELAIDLHVYTDDPAKRTVFINGRRYQQGGVLAEGPMVEEITRDGAVLKYHGRRFLLPRQ